MLRFSLWLIVSVCWVIGTSLPAVAQNAAYDPEKTLLEIELVLPVGATNPLLAQKWRQEFEQVGEAVRIRSYLVDDKAGITERERGPFRVIKITGLIDLDGQLSLPSRTFLPGQAAEIKQWINEIKTYGAQGSPMGKPNWGLSSTQLAELKSELSVPVAEPVLQLNVGEAIRVLNLPEEIPLVPHSSIADEWKTALQSKVKQEIKGLSAGTSLAYILSQQGWGFRPVRMPGDNIQFLVQKLADLPDPWPVGWPETEDRRRKDLVPGLFGFVETGVQQAPLSIVLKTIEQKTGVILLVDEYACLAKELDPQQILVSYPHKKTAWALIVSSIVVNSHMSMHYRQDEAGAGFIWITPFANYTPPKPKPTAAH